MWEELISNGFAPAMSVSAALSLLGALIGLVLPGKRKAVVEQAPAGEAEAKQKEAYGALEHSPSQ